jgi:D-3-phosphoglycerate dehydrogenase / 2-oxoglutarate reductase
MKNSKTHKIVLAEPFDAEVVERLAEVGQVDILEDSSPEALLTAVAQADALLVRSKAHVTARIIEAAPNLKVIGRASPNVDHIDIRAAKRRNISIVYTPNVAVRSVAEFTLGLILSLTRRLPQLDAQLREGKFDTLRQPAGREMRSLTLALLGVDFVAEELGRMCKAAFGMPVIYHDLAGRSPRDLEARQVELDALLTEADILSVHLQFVPETRAFLNAARIAKLKSTAVVVNTSRGQVVDTVALAQALRRRLLGGAGLDVFEAEPLPANHPLRHAPNCLLTPHVAGCTQDASVNRFQTAAEDVIRVLQGEPPYFQYE